MIYVVTGYMRSGTSMMMQALEAGGLPVVKSKERDHRIDIESDGTYRPNPVSLYEATMGEMLEPKWPRQHDGHAIKAVGAALGLLAVHEYKVVVMQRDPEEIRQSVEAGFRIKVTHEQIQADMDEIYRQLGNRRDVHDEVKLISYTAMLHFPKETLAFLDWPIDVKKAAAVVEPKLYRFQREKLVMGL